MVLLMHWKSSLSWCAPALFLVGLTAGLAVYSKPALSRTPAPSATSAIVLNGIDVLERQNFAPLRGLRVGLLTNPTGTDRQRRSTIDLLQHAPGVELRSLFSPEHGIRGDRDEKIGDSRDEKTGLPVFSLYGENRSPSPQQLADLDALVFDIQDVGCRFYTYISTLKNAMTAASKAGLKFFVLDRANPINGHAVEGPLMTGAPSFIACHPLPVRHGLTVGELALLFKRELGLALDLKVIPLQGWHRDMWFDQTGLPWANPSPNMRNLNEAALYPGIGLLEFSALSVGRGTDTPFETFGAPYIDDLVLAAELNRSRLPGVRFVPVRFTPRASVFQGQNCGGVYIVVTDRNRLAPVDVGIETARILHRLYPVDFKVEKLFELLRHPQTIEAINAGKTLAEIKSLWKADLRAFEARCLPFKQYR
jgi:uncharacterized protein YbbC (DUF1343 family)